MEAMAARRREKRIGCLLLVGAAFFAATMGSVRSQVIQKWKTPDGKLYFGDTPPPGSKKIGEEGSSEPVHERPQESTPPAPEKERLSVDASRERTQIEEALNKQAGHLEELDARIAEVQRAPNLVPGWMERRAGFKNDKAESLRELKSQKHATLTTIADLWKRFDKLDASVRKAYAGEAPIWWRSTLSCPKCPSRLDAEDASRAGPDD
jgi:hypothetical protein